MTAFKYKAVDTNGRLSKGVIEADQLRQVRLQLCEQGLTVFNIEPCASSSVRASVRSSGGVLRKRMRVSDLGLVMRHMATLLAAGMPLDEALYSIAEQHRHSAVQAVLLSIRDKVMEGHSLSSAMSDFPKIFKRMYCMTIAAGEKSANLDLLFLQLADYMEQQQKMRRKILQALLYPVTMMGVSVAIVIFMLTYIIPKIIDLFNETHHRLPWMTRLLLACSEFLMQYSGYICLTGLLIIGFFFVMTQREKSRKWIDQCLLCLPGCGKLIRDVNAARFGRMLGILITAGVPILEAMHSAAELIGSWPMRAAMLRAKMQVSEGVTIHRALKNTGYFSSLFIYLVSSGEASGQLATLLHKAASTQEMHSESFMDKLLTLLEPAMILLMGGVVLCIVLAVMLPIFSLQDF